MWIRSFLNNRSQQVVMDNIKSSSISVTSGVPQGSVLGPCLFRFFINDLPDGVSSNVRLFADDTLLYRKIMSDTDIKSLQYDLNMLVLWAEQWQMDFNSSKCQSMTITRKRHPQNSVYFMRDIRLDHVTEVKYLGITISHDLKWNTHIETACSRAKGILGFLGRNLKIANAKTKELAYFALVRPHVEYCATVWDPHTKKLCNKVEMVQRRAARFVSNRWGYKDSVTDMLNNLKWTSLADRRKHARLSLLYKIHNKFLPINFNNMHLLNPNTAHINNATYHIPKSFTNAYNNSFLPRTIIDWNALPNSVVQQSSLNSFKMALTKFSNI
jgi:ribonucleases P/MRP protein subunit RPP40